MHNIHYTRIIESLTGNKDIIIKCKKHRKSFSSDLDILLKYSTEES